MILRLSRRPQALLRATTKPYLSLSTPSLRRHEHTVPLLPPAIRDMERFGVPNFLSQKTVEMNWTLYMPYVCDRLNHHTAGTADYAIPALQLVEKHSHSAPNATLFNWASMAVNNHFFFRGLSLHQTEPSPSFIKDINTNFDDIDNLRQEMIETADAMFGNGFVWLMREHRNGNLRILATYNAGSPFPAAHHRAQSVDMNTQPNNPNGFSSSSPSSLSSRLTAGSFGSSSTNAFKGHTNALNASPILCVNVWQQMWMPDFGILDRRRYLSCWWERINWRAVEDEARAVTQRFGYHNNNAGKSGMMNVLGHSFGRNF